MLATQVPVHAAGISPAALQHQHQQLLLFKEIQALALNPRFSIINLLSNSLILNHLAPYLSITALLNLAGSSRILHYLIFSTPGVFRYLDLGYLRIAQTDVGLVDRGGRIWRNAFLDESLTEEDFYSGPLRYVFARLNRRHILHNVSTLVLDGLSVTAELCHELITSPGNNIRLLSIRDVSNLNQAKLRAALQYACRPSRPKNSPTLKGLYVFGSSRSNTNGDDAWWDAKGRILAQPLAEEWAQTMMLCKGIISFDAVLCEGPCHINSPAHSRHKLAPTTQPPSSAPRKLSRLSVATIALAGCASCGTAPEGMTRWSSAAPNRVPLLAPPPLSSSSLKTATEPRSAAVAGQNPSFVPRCATCVVDRCCMSCQWWWCEDCDAVGSRVQVSSTSEAIVHRSCWDCGRNCRDCIERTQRTCKRCRGGYCSVHNDGSTLDYCDWCSSRGSRRRF